MGIKDTLKLQGSPVQITYPDGSMVRFGRMEDLDRDFDLTYWQSRTSEERFAAAWQLVVDYHCRKGGSVDELRLQRSIGRLQRFPS